MPRQSAVIMVTNIGAISSSNAEATAYLSAVAGFATIVLILLLFLNRRWCYSSVFGRKGCDDILTVNVTAPEDLASHFDALNTKHYPERIYAFETSDDDDELRLRIQQTNEDFECHYEEKNENAMPPKSQEVDLIETALRETALRETRIDDVVSQRAAEYIHTLEAQSSVESDVMAHNDTSLLCGGSEVEEARGHVELSIIYDAPVRCMTVHVLQARGLPATLPDTHPQRQVRVVLLPMKKQKFKTKVRYGENPQFMESFVFHKINPEDVHGLGLRARVYGCERLRRRRLLGEARVAFAALSLDSHDTLRLPLRPRTQMPKLETVRKMSGLLASPVSIGTLTSPSSAGTPFGFIGPLFPGGSVGVGVSGGGGAGDEAVSLARSESASSCCSVRAAPELLLGLQYNAASGHLCVEIIKGSHFRKLSPTTAPDTYVKLSLLSPLGLQMGRCKSTIRKAQSNPLYKELFIFQVALFQLSEVTLMVSVWWRRSVKKNEMVGWFSLGMNCSGREEERHWEDLCQRQGEQIQRWHVLLDS